MSDMSVGRGQPNLVAIRPGGSGDITETHVAWNLHSGVPEIPSPVFHAGRLYMVRDGGLLSCVRTDTGRVVYRERLGAPGQYSASPRDRQRQCLRGLLRRRAHRRENRG